MAQELRHRHRVEGVLAHLAVELTARADGSDHREMVTGTPLTQDGRLAARRVGAHHRRQGVEAAFVHKEDTLT